MFQIARTDTIVHPGAVMIHPTNASIADSAMMGEWWFECLTLGTHC
jgi:hypothetical protein